jgi:hypothetical protein
VPRLDEFDLGLLVLLVLGTIERAEYAIDAVAGITENFSHAPGVQALDDEITDSLAHDQKLRRPTGSGRNVPAGRLLDATRGLASCSNYAALRLT